MADRLFSVGIDMNLLHVNDAINIIARGFVLVDGAQAVWPAPPLWYGGTLVLLDSGGISPALRGFRFSIFPVTFMYQPDFHAWSFGYEFIRLTLRL